jgi:hypothetical protein
MVALTVNVVCDGPTDREELRAGAHGKEQTMAGG